MLRAMAKNADVDRWFEEKKHPRADAIRCVREIVLGADPRITERMSGDAVQFECQGDLASIAPNGSSVTLRLGQGAKLVGEFPHLEGKGDERTMRFSDIEEVRARANELRGVAVAWSKLSSVVPLLEAEKKSAPKKKAFAKAKKSAPKKKRAKR